MAVPGYGGAAQGPQVTIRAIKKDSVDFVLSNVDLACVPAQDVLTQICKLSATDNTSRTTDCGYISTETSLIKRSI
jgi:hypothetical protein